MAEEKKNFVSFPLHLPHEVERQFAEIISRPWGSCREIRGWYPSMDVYENDDSYVVEADLPGVRAEDVKVASDNGDLVIEGSRTLQQSRSDGQFHTMERCAGNFMRRITLPKTVDQHAIEAEFHDGVLRIILHKTTP